MTGEGTDERTPPGGGWAPVPPELLGAMPLVFGPADVVQGYYDLEVLERGQTLRAQRAHLAEVNLWYRGLTLYQRGMLGTWDFSRHVEEGASFEMQGLRSQFLGLGVSSAKVALDALLAGYYSVAFAAIRHMVETFAQCAYVSVHPDQARLWYEQPGGLASQPDPPGMLPMVQAIQAHPSGRGGRLSAMMDKAYASWRVMCKGAHPSGEGIGQTRGEGAGKSLFGPTYRRDLCLVGFEHGLFATTGLLLPILGGIRPMDDGWITELEALKDGVDGWLQALKAEILAAEGELPPESPAAPGPSRQDVRRAWQIIAAWEANATAWRAPLPAGSSGNSPCGQTSDAPSKGDGAET